MAIHNTALMRNMGSHYDASPGTNQAVSTAVACLPHASIGLCPLILQEASHRGSDVNGRSGAGLPMT
jgi:hypothetical protein